MKHTRKAPIAGLMGILSVQAADGRPQHPKDGIGYGYRRRVTLSLCLWFTCALQAGCQNRPSSANQANSEEPPTSAQQILSKMAEAYAGAETYTDAGEFHERAAVSGESREADPIPFSVIFRRPNQIRMHFFGAIVVSDGEKIYATVQELAPQVLEIDSPRQLTRTNFASDEILRGALMAGQPMFRSPQMDLLLADTSQDDLLGNRDAATLLEDADVDGRACFRVQVPSEVGMRVYSIDKETFLLRRLDLPTEQLRKTIDPSIDMTDLQVWFEFKGAQMGHDIDPIAFNFELPDDARRLKQLVAPLPGPRPPRIGEVLGDFEFTDLNGQAVDRKSLEGKVAVIDFWFTTCPPCRESMPILETLYQRYKDNDRVAFFAVSIDDPQDPTITNEHLVETLRSWGANLPIARDQQNQGSGVFKLVGAPSTFLLGPKGKIHGLKVGVHSDYDDFAAAIEGLLDGDDVAAWILEEHERILQEFELRLASASVDPSDLVVEVPRTEIAPANQPEFIKLEKLWQSDDVQSPGNLLVVAVEKGTSRIYVLDGWREIVELDVQGNLIARHELSLPEKANPSFVRMAKDTDGNRFFVAAGVSQQQLHLFDQAWQHQWSFPDGNHAGIADVQFADLSGEGQLQLIVGYWDVVGVQGVTLAGERAWSNRSLQNAMQVAVTGPNAEGHRTVLCTNSRGTLVPIDHVGRHGPDIRVPQRAIINLAAADVDGDGAVELCGLAALGLGKRTAIGIDTEGNELWHYDLPEGVHKHPIEPIVAVQLSAGDGGWLLPGADGSIHLLARDGQLVDRFNHGAALAGVGMTLIDGRPLLLVSSDKGLAAWRVLIGEE